MDYLPDSDVEPVSRKSSIDQYNGFLGVMHEGMFCPIVFDQLDGIVCGEVHSHPIMVYFGEWGGYHYPIKKCTYAERTVITADDEGSDIHVLPEQFGRGDCWHNNFYEEYHNREGAIVDDYGTFMGFESAHTNTVGLDYVTTDDTLESID